MENLLGNQSYLIENKFMKCLKTICYYIYLTLLINFINISYTYSDNYIENFIIPNDFEESALVLNYNEALIGIIQLMPKEKMFSNYTWLKLYKTKENNISADKWLSDRLHKEINNLGKIERLLRGPDSPLMDTLFDSARSALPAIDDTIKKVVADPNWFCENLKTGFNKEGSYNELYCIFPLGMFKYYLVLRLQKINDIYYYISISALNNIRLRKVLEIADSFSLK